MYYTVIDINLLSTDEPKCVKFFIMMHEGGYKFEFQRSPSSLLSFCFKSHLQYITTTQQLFHLLDHLEKTSVKEGLPTARDATYEDKQTLPQRLLNSDLFPESRFLIYNNKLPFKVTCNNFSIACDTTDVVLLGDEILSAVSFGSYMMTPAGRSPIVFFNGNNVSDLLAHLKLHIQRHRSKYGSSNAKAHLKIIIPMTLPTEKVKKSINPFLGKNILYDHFPHETLLVVQCPLSLLKANI